MIKGRQGVDNFERMAESQYVGTCVGEKVAMYGSIYIMFYSEKTHLNS